METSIKQSKRSFEMAEPQRKDYSWFSNALLETEVPSRGFGDPGNSIEGIGGPKCGFREWEFVCFRM